jgi:hypothetical protein
MLYDKKLDNMKYLLIFLLMSLACKKDDDISIMNWKDVLPGSIWSGEFRYLPGGKPQYYSIQMVDDSVFYWFDISGMYNGEWTTDKDRIMLVFSSGIEFSAELQVDRWINLQNNSAQNWQVLSVNLSWNPSEEDLKNKIWQSEAFGNTHEEFVISYLTNTSIAYSAGTPSTAMLPCDYKPGCLYFQSITRSYFGVFVSPDIIEGVSESDPGEFIKWKAIKQ